MDKDDHVLRLKNCSSFCRSNTEIRSNQIENRNYDALLYNTSTNAKAIPKTDRQNILSLDKLSYPLENFNPRSQT